MLLAVVLIAAILLGDVVFSCRSRPCSTSPVRRARTSTRTRRTRCSSASARSTASASGRAARWCGTEDFAPPIRQLIEQARAREGRIRDAIARADLPYDEVADEIDRFVAAMEATATRAQLLWEALSRHAAGAGRGAAGSAAGRGRSGQAELDEALDAQLETLRRMEKQLERFFSEMERILVELDTVRSQLVSVSASRESAQQTELAADVRALRERVGASAEGMAAAFEAGP